MESKLKPIASDNLGQRAYLELRAALADGRFHAGERIRLRELAEAMEISVTPVREAVLQLVNDGALHLKSPRDIRVRELSAEEYREIAQIRVLLECRAIENFVARITRKDVTDLERIEKRHQTALLECDYRAAATIDRRFMFTIFERSGMPLLLDMLDRLWLVARPTVTMLYSDEGASAVDLGNLRLLDALRDGDGRRAMEARRRLIEDCAVVITELLNRTDMASTSTK